MCLFQQCPKGLSEGLQRPFCTLFCTLKQQHSKAISKVHARCLNTKNLDYVLLLQSVEIQQKERHTTSKTLSLGGGKRPLSFWAHSSL